MRKLILTSLFIIGNILSLYSQIREYKKLDVSRFPIIEFVINDRNPDTISYEKFSFYETIKGEDVLIDSFNISTVEDTSVITPTNKTVLILAEVLVHSSRVEQNLTYRNALLESLENFVNEGDNIKISAFSLKDGETKILKDVSENFSDDVDALQKSIEDFEIEDNDYTNKPVSDIFGAIIEGIEVLEDVNDDYPKSILLLSDDRNNSIPLNTEKSAIELALEKNIAVYSIKYNRVGYQQYTDTKLLTKKTYGLQKVLGISSGNLEGVNIKKSNEAEEFIVSALNNSINRAMGLNYKVDLKLNNNLRDGREYSIKVNIGEKSKEITYISPGNWVVAQFQKDPIIASIISFIVFIILCLIIYLIWEKNKSQKKLHLEKVRLQKEKELEQEERIIQQNEELSKIKSDEDKRKKDEERRENERKNKELIREMLRKGSFPILKFSHKDISKQFEVNKPKLNIGRDKETNDICISNNNISRNHFSINFKDGKYTIIDNNSTNGILINGRKLKEAVLNNADIINIADITFIFYE